MDNSVKPKLIMNHYIGDLMDENPLPYILLERDSENKLSVIYVNHAAESFFENTSDEPLQFFTEEVWNQLHVLLRYYILF